MKREGKQHGMVRTYCILPPNPLDPARPAQKPSSPALASPPAAGTFAKVPTKPTNHSKFTGKGGRHLHPAWKPKDKVKGARARLRSSGLDMGQGGLLQLRLTGRSYHKLRLETQSASEILDQLCSPHPHYDEAGDDLVESVIAMSGFDDRPIDYEPRLNLDCLGEYPFLPGPIRRASTEIDEIGDPDGQIRLDVAEFDDDDGDLGFFDVAIVWEAIEGDEGWSIVGEM